MIDAEAKDKLDRWIADMESQGHVRFRWDRFQLLPAVGTFVPPAIVELDRARDLTQEVFARILHVVRWRADRLDSLLEDVAGNGYGLTLGIHSRIDATVNRIVGRLGNGNVFVNRNIIGAVVGTQRSVAASFPDRPEGRRPELSAALHDRAGGDDKHCGRRRQCLLARRGRRLASARRCRGLTRKIA